MANVARNNKNTSDNIVFFYKFVVFTLRVFLKNSCLFGLLYKKLLIINIVFGILLWTFHRLSMDSLWTFTLMFGLLQTL